MRSQTNDHRLGGPSSPDDDHGIAAHGELPRGPEQTFFFPGQSDSAQLARRYGAPRRRMMIVAMVTSRTSTLHRATVVGVRRILATLHLMRDRVTE